MLKEIAEALEGKTGIPVELWDVVPTDALTNSHGC